MDNKGKLENIINIEIDKTALIHWSIRLVDNDIINEILEKKLQVNDVDIVVGRYLWVFGANKRLDGDEKDNLFENVSRLLTEKSNSMTVFDFIV